MEYFLAPQNIVFLIALGFGILLVLGAVLGIGHEVGHDVSHDIGHDHDAGHDHDHDRAHNPLAAPLAGEGNERPLYLRLFSALGIGRVPITVILMIMSFIFGSTGLIANAALEPILTSPYLYGPASFVIATVVAFLLTGKCARFVNRRMPSTESYNVEKRDFVGTTGTLLLNTDTHFGLARVADSKGGVYDVTVRTDNGELQKGKKILIIDYDQESDTYTVEANDAGDTRVLNS